LYAAYFHTISHPSPSDNYLMILGMVADISCARLGKMQKKISLIWLVAAVILLPSAGMAQQPTRWEATLDSAQRLAGQTNRLVLIHFWAPWCGVCKGMEAEVLTQPSVGAELAADYVAVKINADYFPSTAIQYGVSVLPTTVITTPQGQLLDTIRGRVEAAEYVARLSRVAATAKQRGGAIYAQVPPNTAPPAPATPVSTQSPAVAAQPSAMAGTPPSSVGGPSLGVMTQPSVAGGEPAGGSPGLSDDRYADFFQRSQTSPATPIAQPQSALVGPTVSQPAPGYTPPAQSAAVPAGAPSAWTGVPQAYPPTPPTTAPASTIGQSPVPAAAALAYGSQSPPPPTNPSSTSPAGSPPTQLPTINPPLGLDGFCPVTLAERQQWVAADRRWGAIHRGRTYLFSGPEEQRRFFSDPDRYAPAISGNDVVLATEQGQTVPGLREHGVFFGNRVYLFAGEATLEKFALNPNLYANQALGAVRTGAYVGQPRQ
jgi:thiol-disulfide isomerase/thioredoxin/YHS domain-containing protein